MKKTAMVLALTFASISAFADLTDFRWWNTTVDTLVDNSDFGFAVDTATILTYVSDDAVIDFDGSLALSATYGNDILVYDNTNLGGSGRFLTTRMIEGDAGNDYRGKYVYTVVLDLAHATYTGVANVAVGTYYGVGSMSPTALTDMDTEPAPTFDDFKPSPLKTDQQTVIPEPAVASLLVVFGGGLIFAKRRFAKA